MTPPALREAIGDALIVQSGEGAEAVVDRILALVGEGCEVCGHVRGRQQTGPRSPMWEEVLRLRAALAEREEAMRFWLRDILGNLPDKPFDAEATCREALGSLPVAKPAPPARGQ